MSHGPVNGTPASAAPVPAGDASPKERTKDFEEQWIAASLSRERQGFLSLFICAGVLVPLWGVVDRLLEPERTGFLWLRGLDFVVGAVLLVACLKARTLESMRVVGALRILFVGTVIAIMCVRVSPPHYFPYILGFSLVFWSGILHTWPLRYNLPLSAGMLAAYFTARVFVGTPRPAIDEVAGLTYLGSTAVIVAFIVENRRRLFYRTFGLTFDLAARNLELDTTVHSLRQTQTRLVEGEKLSALGRLMASLSHEINNPLNVLANNLGPLRSYVQAMREVLAIAREGSDGGDIERAWAERDLEFVLADAVEAVDTMDTAAQRIEAVHREMRAFVRGDAPSMQPGDFNEGLRATVNMFRRSLPKKVTLAVDLADLPDALFHPGQMNQVFFNLIQNAVDAVEGPGGAITIRTESEAEWIVLHVEDTGPGVSDWAREHLFEPFFTTKGAGKGTGLGLAISYQIVERHHGRIELQDGSREGAHFTVRLPVDRAAAALQAAG